MKQSSAAERRLGFRIHVIVFIPVMIGLVVLNLWLGAPYWVQWVLLAWGIGLLSHGLSVCVGTTQGRSEAGDSGSGIRPFGGRRPGRA